MNMDDYIERKVAETEKKVYGSGLMPVHNKSTLRSVLKAEERFYQREELEHSHSPVGDRNNMTIYK